MFKKVISVCGLVCCVLPASGQAVEEGLKLIADEVADQDYFGFDVDISGTTAIIGAPSTFIKLFNDGYAYLYDIETGEQLMQLVGQEVWGNAWAASSVALSGNTAIAGAPYDYRIAYGRGSVLVFDTITGEQRFKLSQTKNDDGDEGDLFGWSVDISEDRIIVGTPLMEIDGVRNAGAAYIFDTITGEQLLELTASDLQEFCWFSESVAICGNIAIVGASRIEDIGPESGGAYVFDVTTGEQLFKLVASDTAAYTTFGYSVAISGTTGVVGAVLDDEKGVNAGAAYIFDLTTGEELHKLTASDAGEYDQFGWSVDISGNYAIVGSQLNDDAGASSGSAYVFDITTGEEVHKLVASDAAAGDLFGNAVAISGSTVLVGSPQDDDDGSNSGSAHLFSLDLNTPCLADMNGDSALDFMDISIFVGEYVAMNPNADFSGDCTLDFFDLAAFLSMYMTGCP